MGSRLGNSGAARLSDRQPNFVLICTDQHRADYLGCGGHPVLRTPHIDALAGRGGIQFTRSYVSTPQCMPNRATMMTGRLPSAHGARTNGIPLSRRANVFVDLLRSAGYRTALIGKSHLQTMLATPPDRIPPDVRDRLASREPELAQAWKQESGADYRRERPYTWRNGGSPLGSRAYYGFEHLDLCTMHGDMVGGDYERWLRSQHLDAHRMRGRSAGLAHSYSCPQVWRTALPEALYPTRYIQDQTTRWLKDKGTDRDGSPFFLMVSFPDPHHPFTPPGRYWDMYRPEDMPLPPSMRARVPMTPFLRHVKEHSRAPGANEYHALAVSEREAQEAMALTCGMIAMIDDAVGAISDTLRSQGLDRTTVVMFTSDHGDLMGDHGMLLKGPFHYQGLVRVPFIWNDPTQRSSPGRRCDRLTGTIDIAPTILARAGVRPFHGMQGRDVMAAVRDPNAPWRTALPIEEEQHDGVLGSQGPLRIRTLMTERHRLTIYGGQRWGELYDLEQDPYELDNQWDADHAQSLRADLLAELAYLQMEMVESTPLPESLG
jgi:arylsulfatase A-like enzyme